MRKTTLMIFAALLGFTAAVSAQGPEDYRQRRNTLLEELGNAAALVPAAHEADLETFRQSNNFYYLTGVEQPNLLLLLSPEARQAETLYLPARNLDEGSLSEAWTGAKLGPGKETEELTGIASAADRNTFELTFAGLAEGIETLYMDYETGLLDGPKSASAVLMERIGDRYPHLRIVPLSRLLEPMRAIKDDNEIATLQKAIDITGEALEETIRRIEPGMFEYQVEALIEYGFHSRGSQRPGFPSIVGSGPNTVTLHYNSNRRRIEDGELVLMDVGAEYGYYTADITRTVPANGKFSPRQREIYEIVLNAQQAAIDAIRPGITLREVHQAASRVIGDAGYGDYFIHYTSHFLGMDVHDVGRRDQPLEPGMVFTVEPGIYIADENLGVRIEDDVLVTDEGCRVLSSGIPKSVERIESLMSGD